MSKHELSKVELKELRAKKESIANDDNVVFWLNYIVATDNTRRNYLLAMEYFCDYTKKSPQQLMDDAFAEIHAGKLAGERHVGMRIVNFHAHLITKEKMAKNTARLAVNAIRSFYDSRQIDLPKMKQLLKKCEGLAENEAIPEKEDIQAALHGCDPLERAIILVGCASGLSMVDIRNLKIKNVRDINPKTGITTIKLVREKTNVKFTTFLTPEAGIAVQKYLDWRSRTSKTSRKSALVKQAIVNDNGYLFIKRHVPGEYLKTHDEELRHIDHDAFLFIYRVIAERCGKMGELGKRNLIRSHNTRKYFYNALRRAGCDSAYVEHWMGHAADKTVAAYDRPDPEVHAVIYEKYVKALTIDPEPDKELLTRYNAEVSEKDALVEEIKQLREDNTRLAVEKSEVEKLSNDFKDFHNRLEKIKFGREAKKEFDWIGLKKP